MADQVERVVLEVEEGPAVEGAKRANKGLEDVEKTAKRTSENINKSFEQTGQTTVRVMDRSASSIKRLLDSVEQRAAFAGKSASERLGVERDLIERRLQRGGAGGPDLDRNRTAFQKLIDEQKKHETQNDSHSSSVRRLGLAIKDTFEGRMNYAVVEAGYFAQTLGGVATVVAGGVLAIGGLGLALFELTKHEAGAAKELSNFADRTGLTLGQAKQLSLVSQLAGTDLKAFENSARSLSVLIEDSGGKGAKAARELQQLGVSTRTVSGDERELGAILLDTIEALSHIENSTERIAKANQVFGRGSKEVQPLIKDYQEYKKTLQDLGFAFDANGTQKLLDFQREIEKSDIKWKLFKERLAQKVEPIIIEIITSFTRPPAPEAPGPGGPGGPKISPNNLLFQSGDELDRATAINIAQSLTKLGYSPTSNTLQREAKKFLDLDLEKGRKLTGVYEPRLRSTSEEYLQSKISAAKEEISKLNTTLISPDVGESAKRTADALLRTRTAEVRQLELGLKLIQGRKSAEEELIKIHEEANAKRGLGRIARLAPEFVPPQDLVEKGILAPGDATSTQRKLIEFATKPGVSDQQITEAATALTPLLRDEQRHIRNKIIADGKNSIVTTVAEIDKAIGREPPEDKVSIDAQFSLKHLNIDFNRRLQDQNKRVERIQELQPILEGTLAAQRQIEAGARLGSAQLAFVREGPPKTADEEISRINIIVRIREQDSEEQYTAERNRIDALYQYDVTLEDRRTELVLRHVKERQDIEIEAAHHVAEVQQRKAEEFKRTFAEGVLALQNGGGRGFDAFLKSQGQNIERRVLENAGGLVFERIKGSLGGTGLDPKSTLGKLFEGTPLGGKHKIDQLSFSGDNALRVYVTNPEPPARASDSRIESDYINRLFGKTASGRGGALSVPGVAFLPGIVNQAILAASGFGGGTAASAAVPAGAVDTTINYAADSGNLSESFSSVAPGSFGSLASIVGGPGGTSGFAGPVAGYGGGGGPLGLLRSVIPGLGGGGTNSGGLGGLLNFGKGGLSNLGKLFGFEGNGVLNLGSNGAGGTLVGNLGVGNLFKALGHSPVAALAGGALAFDGLKRGGVGGLLETTGGGALLGFKFGGPIGAAIGAGVGAIAGAIRLGFSSRAEQVQEQVKSAFGLKIDKGFAVQIDQIAQQKYGGKISVAIRSDEVLKLLELYARSTGQPFGLAQKPRASDLVDTQNGLAQKAIYENGKAISFTGLPTFGGVASQVISDIPQRSPLGGVLPYQGIPSVPFTNPRNGDLSFIPTGSSGDVTHNVNVQLDGEATSAFLQGQTASFIQSNPRSVSSAVGASNAGNFDRRQTAAQYGNPLALVS